MLLTWSSKSHGRALGVLSEWASSSYALSLRQKLVKEFQDLQEPQQLVLTLAALLCHAQLLPYSSADTISPKNDCYLADLNVLLNGEPSSNQRTVLQWVGYSFLRVLNTRDDEDKCIGRLLADALDAHFRLLGPLDSFMNQYVAERLDKRLSHQDACTKLKNECLTEMMTVLSIEPDSSSPSMNSVSEEDWMLIDPPRARGSSKAVSQVSIGNLGED